MVDIKNRRWLIGRLLLGIAVSIFIFVWFFVLEPTVDLTPGPDHLQTGAKVAITDVETQVTGSQFNVTFRLENVGDEKAQALMLDPDVRDQDGDNRTTGGFTTVAPGLAAGATVTETISLDIQPGDSRYTAHVDVWWMAGNASYTYNWTVEQ